MIVFKTRSRKICICEHGEGERCQRLPRYSEENESSLGRYFIRKKNSHLGEKPRKLLTSDFPVIANHKARTYN